MIEKPIIIDTWNQLTSPINLVQFEKNGRVLNFTITENGKSVDLTDCVVTFYAHKPSGERVYNTCIITDKIAGKISYTVTGQTVTECGELNCTIEILKNNVALRTIPFNIYVYKSDNYAPPIESTSEFTALEEKMTFLVGLERQVAQLNLDKENVANKSTNTTLGTSDILYPTQNAVKTYADTKVSLSLPTIYTSTSGKTLKYPNGLLIVKGLLNTNVAISTAVGSLFASSGINLPYANAGTIQFAAGTKPQISFSTSTNEAIWVVSTAIDVGNAYVCFYCPVSKAAASRDIYYTAIGFWQ